MYNIIITIMYLLVILIIAYKYYQLRKENEELGESFNKTLTKAEKLLDLTKTDQNNFIKFISGIKDKIGLKIPEGKIDKEDLVALLKKRIEVLVLQKDLRIKELEITEENLRKKDLLINAGLNKLKEKNKTLQKKDQKLLYYKRRAKTLKGFFTRNCNIKVKNFIKTLAGENPGVNKKAKNNLKNKEK